MTLSLHRAPPDGHGNVAVGRGLGSSLARVLIETLSQLEGARLKLAPWTLRHARFSAARPMGAATPIRALARAHYGASVRRGTNALRVVGAARALGNPAGWARGVVHSVEAAIKEPIAGLSEAVDEKGDPERESAASRAARRRSCTASSAARHTRSRSSRGPSPTASRASRSTRTRCAVRAPRGEQRRRGRRGLSAASAPTARGDAPARQRGGRRRRRRGRGRHLRVRLGRAQDGRRRRRRHHGPRASADPRRRAGRGSRARSRARRAA